MTAGLAPRPAAPAGVLSTADAISAMSHDARSGWRTTEFWLAITTWLLPILALVFHRDLSSLAMPLAAVGAGVANAAYSVSRAIAKNGHAQAVATVVAGAATRAAAGPAAGATAAADASGSAGAGAGAAAGGFAAAGSAAPSPGLSGADAAALINAMTAALEALAAAAARLPAQPGAPALAPPTANARPAAAPTTTPTRVGVPRPAGPPESAQAGP